MCLPCHHTTPTPTQAKTLPGLPDVCSLSLPAKNNESAVVQALQAVHSALKQRPALLVCSVGLSFPTCLLTLWQSLKQQQ